MDEQEEISHLTSLIEQHKRNLYNLEEIAAQYGIDIPIHLQNSIFFEKQTIQELQVKLGSINNSFDAKPVTAVHNMPRRPFFVGRTEEIEIILSSLQPESRTYIVNIEGIGGVGKTALAIEAGYRCIEQGLFSRIIWMSAKKIVLMPQGIEKESPELENLSDMYISIANFLENHTIGNLPFTEQEKTVLSLLSQHTTLIIIDNIEALGDEDVNNIFNFLRRTPITVKVIATSRMRLPEGQTVNLKGLHSAESVRLLEWHASQRGIAMPDKYTDRIVKLTGGIPLALLWMQGQVLELGHQIDQALERLEHDPELPLLQYCFNNSWDLLPNTSRLILYTLALHETSASREAIKEIVEIQNDEESEAISSLFKLSFISINPEPKGERISILPLTKRFVNGQFKKDLSIVNKLERQMIQYYANLVSENYNFKDWRKYDDILEDRNNILAAARLCYQQAIKGAFPVTIEIKQLIELLVRLAKQFGSVLWQRAYWHDRLSLASAAIRTAEIIGDWQSISTLARNITWIYYYQSDYVRAEYWATLSLESALKSKDQTLIIAAKRALGTVQEKLGNFALAEQLLLEVVSVCSENSDDDYFTYSLGYAQNGLGDLELERGNLVEAEKHYQSALATWQSPGRTDPIRHTSICLNGLGFAALQQGRTRDAQGYFNESLEASTKFQRIEEMANARLGLAKTLLQILVEGKGDDEVRQEAINNAQEALDIYKQQGMRRETLLTQDVLKDLFAVSDPEK